MSAADPFLLGHAHRDDSFDQNNPYGVIGSKSVRSSSINGAVRNLILIGAGQSNMASVGPSAYTPTNASVIDNFNILNGLNYQAADPLLGCTFHPSLGAGGCVLLRLADLFVTNGKFDRVIIVPVAVGGTSITQWQSGGVLSPNIPAAMARLASRGIIPGMTGVTFCFVWGQGESDIGMSQATYQAGLSSVLTSLFATGFNGRAFINKQTWNAGVTDTNVRAAQAAVTNGTTIFGGADADTLNATNRQADNIHFNNTGMPAFTTLTYNAMVASGAPY